MSAPGLIVAAPASGAGKTMLTVGLLRAFRRRGLKVGSFKIGPDYLDPAFHAAAAGRPCYNVDSWAMRFDTLAGLIEESGRDAGLLIGEGVMGLFDGAIDGTGSTADVAALFGLPVVLLVDAARMGASAAALIDGFRRHRDDVTVAAVVFNRVAGRGHAELLARACFEHLSTPILGYLPRRPDLSLPSRHLGLVQAAEHADLGRFIEAMAELVESELDLDRLLRLASPPSVSLLGPDARPLPALGQRIAIARDEAFAFAYPSVLEGWRRQGAELHPFSPLADEPPLSDCDAVFLPGGYPELHAGRLAGNGRFLDGLGRAARRGSFVYGECGGYMVLGERLQDGAGASHRMAGLLPVATSFAEPQLRLGYRHAALIDGCALGPAGAAFRGHEFHHCLEIKRDGPSMFRASDARRADRGEAGCRQGNVAGSFLHLIDRAEPREAKP